MNIHSMEYNQHTLGGMPPQKLLSKDKKEEWWKRCINAIISQTTNNDNFGRSSKGNKQTNYDLVNSIFNRADFKFLTNPTNINDDKVAEFGGLPTLLR